ncbi:glycosyltransferase [Granulicella cerasi]|uniref:Glycosyltransferase n=1 Tax=Granulicella cerasi TaxID=741063 RepID=A0ABW1ZA53_9BACT|nr:glycosyltransferase family 2 protein [Granulicella cerasi]
MHIEPYPWHIAVLIPARNEEFLLSRCLRSVQAARAALPPGVTSDVVFIADCCSDNTLSLAKEMLGASGVAASSQCGSVGLARRLAARIALKRCAGPLRHCWLANTDADCEVPETWLIDQISLAEQGAEAIAGVVSVDSFEEHPPYVATRFRDSYLLNPDGTHPHVHGANLGVRADVYLAAGGWSGLSTAEDHDLWNRVMAHGRDCRSLTRLEVITSGRVRGRAPNGFAAALAAHGSTHPEVAA